MIDISFLRKGTPADYNLSIAAANTADTVANPFAVGCFTGIDCLSAAPLCQIRIREACSVEGPPSKTHAYGRAPATNDISVSRSNVRPMLPRTSFSLMSSLRLDVVIEIGTFIPLSFTGMVSFT